MRGRIPSHRCDAMRLGNRCVYDATNVNIFGRLGDEAFRTYAESNPGPYRYYALCDVHTEDLLDHDKDWVQQGEYYGETRWDNYPGLVLFEYDSEGWWQLAAAFAILAEFRNKAFGVSERFTEVEVRLHELGAERLTSSAMSNNVW